MSSPKHLWSGDWERESQQPPSAPEPTRAQPEADAGSGQPGGSGPGRPNPRRRLSRPVLLSGVAGIVVLAITAGVVLAFTLNNGSSTSSATQTQTTAQASPSGNSGYGSGGSAPSQTTPQSHSTTPLYTIPQTTTTPQTTTAQAVPTTPVSSGALYDWLGMQVTDSTQGPTVVTVIENGAADQAGVDPGDIIAMINSTPVDSMAQVRAAVAKLKTGQQFQLTVDRGSTQVTLAVTLTGSPSRVS